MSEIQKSSVRSFYALLASWRPNQIEGGWVAALILGYNCIRIPNTINTKTYISDKIAQNVKSDKVRDIVVERLDKIKEGSRDFRF